MNISNITSLRKRANRPETAEILGVPISQTNLTDAVGTILTWVAEGEANLVCIRDVHGVMRAQDDPTLLDIHHQAGMVTPDGMPLVWVSRWRGHTQTSRVCGPDLVDAVCGASVSAGIRHYFYGGKPGVAERMAEALKLRHPGLLVAGTGTPPFRALTAEEDLVATEEISRQTPGIVWVGLSTPKQEYWMKDHVGRIPGATLIGVGAAFDFYSGEIRRAPIWMQRNGLEWLYRLQSEPRRLWRRYLVMAPQFVGKVIMETVRHWRHR